MFSPKLSVLLILIWLPSIQFIFKFNVRGSLVIDKVPSVCTLELPLIISGAYIVKFPPANSPDE